MNTNTLLVQGKNRLGWIVVQVPFKSELHCIPVNDLTVHIASEKCLCFCNRDTINHSTIESQGDQVIIQHRSFDGREFFENQ